MFTRRKKPRVKAKTVDAQYVGSEPTQINNEIDLVQAYNYYNYHNCTCRSSQEVILKLASV